MLFLQLNVRAAMTALLLLAPVASFACRCVEPGPSAPAYKNAAAVIVGTVVSVRHNLEKTAIATVRVSKRWKKEIADEVEVATVATTCAFDFVQGTEYLFYLRELPANGGYSTARCRGNVAMDQSEKQLYWLKRNAVSK